MSIIQWNVSQVFVLVLTKGSHDVVIIVIKHLGTVLTSTNLGLLVLLFSHNKWLQTTLFTCMVDFVQK